MDQHIFDQLDQLERGARDVRPRQQIYNDHNMQYPKETRYTQSCDADLGFSDEEQYGDENVDPQMSYSQFLRATISATRLTTNVDSQYYRPSEESQHHYVASQRPQASLPLTDMRIRQRPMQPSMQPPSQPLNRRFDLCKNTLQI